MADLANYPRAAVSAIILGEDSVLLVRRGHEPAKGLWSLPGGSVEPGETVREAVTREVLEETGLVIEPTEIADVRDVIGRQDGEVTFHYTIISFRARVLSGVPIAAGDADEVRWVRHERLGELPTTEGLAEWLAGVLE